MQHPDRTRFVPSKSKDRMRHPPPVVSINDTLYLTRALHRQRFKCEWMQKEGNRILSEYLMSKAYDPQETEKWCQDLTQALLEKASEGRMGLAVGTDVISIVVNRGAEIQVRCSPGDLRGARIRLAVRDTPARDAGVGRVHRTQHRTLMSQRLDS